MSEETYKELLDDFKRHSQLMMDKSQDDFEKQLIYISGGGLGASVFFIEKIVKNIAISNHIFLLVTGWIMLGLTLCINLFSHYLAGRYNYLTLKEINCDLYDSEKAETRNKHINLVNIISLCNLAIGLIALLIYITLNLKS